MATSAELFGNTDAGFSHEEANRILREQGIPALKIYYMRYLVPLIDGSVAVYNPRLPGAVKVAVYSRAAANTTYLTLSAPIPEPAPAEGEAPARRQRGRPRLWKSSEWLATEINLAMQVADHRRPLIFEEGGQLCLNTVVKMPHADDARALTDFEAPVQEAVRFVVDHLRMVFCSGRGDQLAYLLSWLARVAAGERCRTICWIRSAPGIGKTLLATLMRRVLGGGAVAEDNRVDAVVGQYNDSLNGKLLYIFTDPVMGKDGFRGFYEGLKTECDSATLLVREKYRNTVEVAKTVSFMVFSQTQVMASESADRRLFMPDTDYNATAQIRPELDAHYRRLADICEGHFHADVPAAFAAFLREWRRDHSEWRENVIPLSDMRAEMLVSSLSPFVRFIKENFVLVNPDTGAPAYRFKRSLKDLHDHYENWASSRGFQRGPVNRNTVSTGLREIGLERAGHIYINKATVRGYDVPHAKLVELFRRRKFIDANDYVGPEPNADPSGAETGAGDPAPAPQEAEAGLDDILDDLLDGASGSAAAAGNPDDTGIDSGAADGDDEADGDEGALMTFVNARVAELTKPRRHVPEKARFLEDVGREGFLAMVRRPAGQE